MFTVSFIYWRVLSLLGVESCSDRNIVSQVNVHYFVLRGLYRLVYADGVGRSNYFIQMCSALRRFFIGDINSFHHIFVVVLFRTTRIDLHHSFNAHSTNRNSDVLYLDRFSSTIQTQIIRRIAGAYYTVGALTTEFSSGWVIRFSPTTIVKYINATCTDVFNVLYLRKTKIFNKGRYSRNRQFYRTGVYWCLYINIIAVIGMYFWFYRFVMNFGYLWWLFYLSLASFVIAKTLHFRLYTIGGLCNSVTADVIWFSACLNAFIGGARDIHNTSSFIFRDFSLGSFSCLRSKLYDVFNSLFIQSNSYYVFMWFYSPVNYYVQSLTINPAKIFLNSGKISYLSQVRDLLVR